MNTNLQTMNLEPMGDVLRRTGSELRKIHVSIVRIEEMIGTIIDGALSSHVPEIHELQYLDHLGQEITAVAEFLTTLSSNVPHDLLVDTHQLTLSLNLADLGRRLRNAEYTAHHTHAEPCDKYEIFD